MDQIHANLRLVDFQLQDTDNVSLKKPISSNAFQGIEIVRELEQEALKDPFDGSVDREVERYRQKLDKAINALIEKPKPVDTVGNSGNSNEWTAFEKLESERRDYVKAAYHRFRCGPIPDLPTPNTGVFEYKDVSFPLDSGEMIQQPIASIRPIPEIPNNKDHEAELNHKTDKPFDCNQAVVGVDRDAFVAQLVSKSSLSSPVLRPGQQVRVVYYGVHFGGIVVQRNFGSRTVSIQFNDGTINDLPLHAIIMN